jgi:hypothetical protein
MCFSVPEHVLDFPTRGPASVAVASERCLCRSDGGTSAELALSVEGAAPPACDAAAAALRGVFGRGEQHYCERCAARDR